VIIEPLVFSPDLQVPAALASDDDSTAFEDTEGQRVVARACREGDWCWLWLDGTGSYRFPAVATTGTLRAEVVPDPGASRARAHDDYYRSLAPVALQVYGYEALHGTAVMGEGGALVLLAPSRSGKTTLACELVERGHRLVADDAVVMEVPADPRAVPVLRPLPFVPRLRDDSAARYGLPVRDKTVVTAEVGLGDPVPLAGFVMLDRRADVAAPRLARLGPSTALKALLSRCYFHYSSTDDDRQRKLVAAYLRVAAGAPVYELSYPDGYDRLAETADLLQAECLGREPLSRGQLAQRAALGV